jgi:hypothetical protein
LQKERTADACRIHGHRSDYRKGVDKSPEYQHWLAIKSRCENPKDKDYARYGARGIYVSSEWQSFERFVADVGKRPEGMTIDRVDNDGPYAPWNWRWATDEVQANNRRTTVMLTFAGVTKSLTNWAKEVGLTRNTIYLRIASGWSVEKALTTPYDKRKLA